MVFDLSANPLIFNSEEQNQSTATYFLPSLSVFNLAKINTVMSNIRKSTVCSLIRFSNEKIQLINVISFSIRIIEFFHTMLSMWN